MSKADVILAVSTLVAAYRKEDSTEELVNLYVNSLKDVEPALLSKAVERIIRTKKFFPTLSEMREAVARSSGAAPSLTAETQAFIRAADVSEDVYRRDGSLAYTERYWRWPEGINATTRMAIEETLARVGEPNDQDGKPIFGWERAFGEVYERVVEDIMATMDFSLLRLPPSEPPKRIGPGE